jgi:hypothetical protein
MAAVDMVGDDMVGVDMVGGIGEVGGVHSGLGAW